MNSWKVILATMVIFAAGVVTGGILTWRLQQANLMRRTHRPAELSTPAGWRLEFLRRAQRELDLSPDQREKVDKILKQSQERTRDILEPVSPQLRAEMQRTKEEFRSVLSADQQAKFDEILKKPLRPLQHRPQAGRSNSIAHPMLRTNSP